MNTTNPDKNTEKHVYVRPKVVSVRFRAEVGYASSSTLDNLAQKLDNQINDQLNMWQAEQQVGGYNNTGEVDDGIAAGYFEAGSTDGWFGTFN